jgi:predicted Rossmann fold flavoprotein
MLKVAVIGGGAAGFAAAIAAGQKINGTVSVTVFEKKEPLATLLYTGGGRCNLAHAEYNFKNLASRYPRGEKFLYSVFSRFDTSDTVKFFASIGVKTYTQDDGRIFPVSDSAEDVRSRLLAEAGKQGIIIKSGSEVKKINRTKDKFTVYFDNQQQDFDRVIISTGGRFKGLKHTGFELAKQFGHMVTELRPALYGLKTQEKWIKELAGITVKNLNAKVYYKNDPVYTASADCLFTHEGISGHLAYNISSYCAFFDFNPEFPLKISLNFTGKSFQETNKMLLTLISDNSKKNAVNIVCELLPKSLAYKLLELSSINPDTKASYLSKTDRENIAKMLTSFEINAVSPASSGEIVTAGGIELDEIDPKTMESKIIKGLYFCGEILNIDGLTGGFNLQACWSTGHLAGKACI